MRVKDLKEVLFSPVGDLQETLIWNIDTHKTECRGCSIEYAVEEYGDWVLV